MTENKGSDGTDRNRAENAVDGGRRLRRWLLVGLIAAAVVALALSGIPYGISYGLKQWFTSMGARSVEVGDVDFNPFTGRLDVEDLLVTDESDATMRVKAARFDFAWLPLWKKRFLLEAVGVEDGELQILREPEGGWVVGVIALTAAEPETPGEPTEWQIGLHQIDVRDLKVTLSLPQFTNEVYINSASIQRAVVWEPDVPATIAADYTLDGAPVQLDAEVFPFRKVPEAEGRLKIDGVGIERYLGLLQPTLNRLSGTAGADLAFKVSVGDDITSSTEGALSVQDAVVAGVDFDTAHQRLAWTGKFNVVSGDEGQQIDGDGKLELAGVKITLPGQYIVQEQLGYEGNFSVTVTPEAPVPAVTAEGALAGSGLQVNVEEPATALDQGSLTWNGRVDVSSDDAGLHVQGDGMLETADTNLTLSGQGVTEDQLKWSGKLALLLAQDAAASTVTTDGTLESGNLVVEMADSGLALGQSDLAWQGKIVVAGLADAMTITSDGTLKGGETRVESPDFDVHQTDLAWEGQFELGRKPDAEPVLAATGTLVSGGLEGRVRKSQLEVIHEGLDWRGRIGSAASDKAGASGSLKLKGPALRALQGGLTIAAADELRLEGLSMPGLENIAVADMQVDNLAVGVSGEGAESGGLTRAGGLKLNGIRWRAGERAAIEAATLENLDVQLVRTAEGGWQAIDEIRAATGGEAGASDEEAVQEPPPAESAPGEAPTGDGTEFAIGRVAITGDSRLHFEDKAVTPPALFEIALQETEIGSLDTAQPAQESPLKLTGKLGKAAHLSAEGFIKPYAEPFEADLRGKITNLAVRDISPYAADAIGYELTKGRFTAVMEFKAEGGKVEGNNELVFNELEVKAVPDAKSKLSVPLETGLAMLRDREGRIKLKVPVSGDVENPEFSAADAINQALVKATEKAAVGYLAMTLQPWGAILLAADLAKDFGSGATAKLDPVTFAAGSSELKPEFDDYFAKVATLLEERPDVQLRLCGRAVQQDRATPVTPPPVDESKWKKLFDRKKEPEAAPPSDADLVQLARDRATKVLDKLVEDHAVPAERIYTCDPKPDPEDAGEPRVDVGI